MGNFLRENWLWIVTPLVLVLGGLAFMVWFMGGDDTSAPFIYNIF